MRSLDKYISPILNYACEVWGFHKALDIEQVQLCFFRRMLGVKKSTQLDVLYGLLGRFPMIITRHCRIIKYWLAIVNGKKSSYVTTMYMSSLNRIDTVKDGNWAYNVKQLLCPCGIHRMCLSQQVFLKLTKQD